MGARLKKRLALIAAGALVGSVLSVGAVSAANALETIQYGPKYCSYGVAATYRVNDYTLVKIHETNNWIASHEVFIYDGIWRTRYYYSPVVDSDWSNLRTNNYFASGSASIFCDY